MSFISDKFAAELNDKETRELFLAAQNRTAIVSQIRAIRADRGWTQAEFAKQLGKPQSNVSQRLENRDYGGFTLSTLLDIANAFDVGLLVRFVPYEQFLEETDDLSPGRLRVRKFDPAVLARITKSLGKGAPGRFGAWAGQVDDTGQAKAMWQEAIVQINANKNETSIEREIGDKPNNADPGPTASVNLLSNRNLLIPSPGPGALSQVLGARASAFTTYDSQPRAVGLIQNSTSVPQSVPQPQPYGLQRAIA